MHALLVRALLAAALAFFLGAAALEAHQRLGSRRACAMREALVNAPPSPWPEGFL